MDYVLHALPKDARPLGSGYYRVGSRTYVEADAIDYSTGEVSGRVFRDIRFEYPDPTPVHVPIYLKRAETTDQRIKRLMNEQRSWEAWCKRVDEGIEDMDDFDIPERPEFTSKYEDFLDLKREASRIPLEEVEGEIKKRTKRRKSDAQMDIEDVIPDKSTKQSSDIVDNPNIGHNRGPSLKERIVSRRSTIDNSSE